VGQPGSLGKHGEAVSGDINTGTNALSGTVLDAISKFIPAKSIQMSYALSGNEFLAYERRQDVISPLVGMAVGVVPLPRPMPQLTTTSRSCLLKVCKLRKTAKACPAWSTPPTWHKENAWLNTR
jgi:hypothetical protein